ncbi:MAG: EamA family transporter [Acidimicrobiales bacterium]
MLFATLLALGSAVVHASWNVLIKTGEDRAMSAWGQFAAAAVVSLLGLLVVGGPGWHAMPYLVGSGLVHVVYLEALVGAYSHGDFSMSYPLARGTGAVGAAVGSVIVLGDHLSPWAWVAIAVAGVGLVSLRAGAGVPAADDVVLGDGGDATVTVARRPPVDLALAWAVLTGAAIATYSLIDSAGSRSSSSGVSYGLAVCASAGIAVTVANAVRPSRRARASSMLTNWRRNVAGGVGTVVAYTLVLVAVRHAPVGYVTMLRESSVVLGAVVGWLWLGEAFGRRRLISSSVILVGLVLLVAVE